MPPTTVYFYRDEKGRAPVVEWLKELRRRDARAYANCVAAIERLESLGYELRRPAADYLRDGIYELRAKRGRVNYRILYFFRGKNVAILAHALTKEDEVPAADIERAINRKRQLERNPDAHTYDEEIEPWRTKDALTIIDRITGDDAKVRRMIAKARINAEAAQMIHDARKKAGLSQKELAELIGTTQSVIARLEDADYQGHSLSMLQRIAEALECPLTIHFGERRRCIPGR